jgi:arylsulfatase A-like enzyme
LTREELLRLNEEVAAPWAFEEKNAHEEIADSDIETLRGLYAGEVETVDSHLETLYETLETEGLLENTILIITADHGENLGETDEMGRMRMGHEASVSEAVLNVPLVIAHPNLSERSVSETVSLVSLYDLFMSPNPMLDSNGEELSELVRDHPTVSQYPPKGGRKETLEKYPDASAENIEHAASESSVVAYAAGWKVVGESTGYRWAKKGGDSVPFPDVPETLATVVQGNLEMFSNSVDENISDNQVSQLEALGYM